MPKIHLLPPNTAPALDDPIASDDMSTANNDTKQITLAQVLSLVYPVGSYYFNGAVTTDPATLLGFGTWVAVAGKVLVGLDSGQTEFDTLLETGGAKTHTLTSAEMPSHTHSLAGGQNQWLRGGTGDSAASLAQTGAAFRVQITNPTDATGGGGAHNNLQPYEVVKMWRRTA